MTHFSISDLNEHDLICNLNPNKKHIFKDPKQLPCNRTFCSECINNSLLKGKTYINCKFCSNEHYFNNASQLPTNKRVFSKLKTFWNEKCENAVNEVLRYKSHVEETFSNKSSILENFFDHMKEDVIIRIESIKIDLDKLGEDICSELDEYKKEIDQQLDDLNEHFECTTSVKKIESIEYTTEGSQIKIENKLIDCENYLKELKEVENSFYETLRKLTFDINDKWKPDKSLIGLYSRKSKLNIQRLRLTRPKKIDLTSTTLQLASGICALDDDTLCVTDSESNEIVLLDKSYQQIDRVPSIIHNNQIQKFNYPMGICTNNKKDTVYLCDYQNDRVLLIDKQLANIKYSISKSNGYINNNAIDFCYYDDCLFILDNGGARAENHSIKQFTHDGEYIRELLISSDNQTITNPVRIKICNNIIAILEDWTTIYIYDINGNYKSMQKTRDGVNTMYFIEGYLFTLSTNGMFTCYDINSKYEIKQVFERYIDLLDDVSDYMTYFDNKFIIIYCYSNYLAVFDGL